MLLILLALSMTFPRLTPMAVYQTSPAQEKKHKCFVRIEIQTHQIAFVNVDVGNPAKKYSGMAKIDNLDRLRLCSALEQKLSTHHIHHLSVSASDTSDALMLRGRWFFLPFTLELSRVSNGISPELNEALGSLATAMRMLH